jgi:hypothetical protein
MAGLLDFLQSASNSAASNVSAPVDALAWLLRKAGLPVPEDAIGGSEWMQQQGLTRPVQQSGASLAGETFGLLAPVVAAAKAPQIAGGLLKMGENAAAQRAPGMVGAERGAIVYHGSPHKFDAFDSSKIGTGEGAQAYGHGLYLAESPGVAKAYQETLAAKHDPKLFGSGVTAIVNGQPANVGSMGSALDSFVTGIARRTQMGKESWDDAVAAMTRNADMNLPALEREVAKGNLGVDGHIPKEIDRLRGIKDLAKTLKKEDVVFQTTGNLYKVDLPDEKIARMLDWDKPLSQQAPEVRKLLEKRAGFEMASFDEASKATYLRPKHKLALMTGGEYVQSANLTHGGPAPFSKVLQESGIPGVRYLDGGSRTAGSGTSNFVLFPGEEEALRILERNGQTLR